MNNLLRLDGLELPEWWNELSPEARQQLGSFLNKKVDDVITYGMVSALTVQEVANILFEFATLVLKDLQNTKMP